MSYEDLITIKAFLVALESLDQPLPVSLRNELNTIAKALPESAYELHDLAERYEPLNQKYLAVLQDCPGEGERLKSVASETDSDTKVNNVEALIQKLRQQINQASSNSVKHLIAELGWTREQAAAIRYRLAVFREDWEAPGMEIYDDL